MSSRPWDVRLRRLMWQPVPTTVSVRTRVRIMALIGLPLAVWYFGWLLNPDRIGTPYLYGLLIAAEIFNMIQALGFWWTCASERVRQPKPPEPAGGRRRVRPRLQGAGRHRRPHGRGRRGPARRRGAGLGARRRQRRRHARPRRPLRRGLHPPRRAHRREGGQHQQRAHAHRRALRRRLRLRPRGGRRLPRGDARLHGRSLRSRSCRRRSTTRTPTRTASPRRPGPSRRCSSARSPAARTGSTRSSAAAPTCCSAARRSRASAAFPTNSLTEDFELSIWLHERGLEVGLRAGGALARPRPRGHGLLRLPAAALGARLPVGPAAGPAGAAPAEAQGAVRAVGDVLPLGLDGADLHELPGDPAADRGPADRGDHRPRVPAALRALLRRGADHGRARRRGRRTRSRPSRWPPPTSGSTAWPRSTPCCARRARSW